MPAIGRIVVASSNRHKVGELRAMLAPLVFDAVGLDRFEGVPAFEETADTFAGNARIKAEGTATWLEANDALRGAWVLADDSGICVDALGGAPGVLSARFAGPDATDEQNNARLVAELRHRGLDRSAAHYACVLALVGARPQTLLFEGRWPVEVRTEARGTGGFGYDPHAWIDDGRRTVAELELQEKARVSHRGRALEGLRRWLIEQRPG
jgi:XTP/dITP diphosphohydrolase